MVNGKCLEFGIRYVWDHILPFGIFVIVDTLCNLSVYPISPSLFVYYSSDGSIILDKAAPFILWATSEEVDGPELSAGHPLSSGRRNKQLYSKGAFKQSTTIVNYFANFYFQNEILNSK